MEVGYYVTLNGEELETASVNNGWIQFYPEERQFLIIPAQITTNSAENIQVIINPYYTDGEEIYDISLPKLELNLKDK